MASTHYQDKINSLNADVRTLSDTISAKDARIQLLLEQLSTYKSDCENYESEIHNLFQEKKDLTTDMNILTEAFEKRGLSPCLLIDESTGELINELEANNLLLNSHLSKQVGTLKSQEEIIQQLNETIHELTHQLTSLKDSTKRDV